MTEGHTERDPAAAALRSLLAELAADGGLLAADRFAARAAAIDQLEFAALGWSASLPAALRRAAEAQLRRLRRADRALFAGLRAEVRRGACRGRALADRLVALAGPGAGGRPAYDELDLLVNGLLLGRPLPGQSAAHDPEMVAYQQTPARVILELVARARPTPQDVVYDLGSGLGHVPLLVGLLSEAWAVGVEVDPGLWAYARATAAELGVARAAFALGDVRGANCADGTIFYLYTPFRGAILAEVLGRLALLARRRPIRLFGYGPCALSLAAEPWLELAGPGPARADRLEEFSSR